MSKQFTLVELVYLALKEQSIPFRDFVNHTLKSLIRYIFNFIMVTLPTPTTSQMKNPEFRVHQ